MATSSAVDIAYAPKSCSPPQLVLGLDIETSDWDESLTFAKESIRAADTVWDEPLTFAKESIRVACSYHFVSRYFRYDLQHSMLISFGMSTAVAPYQAFGPDCKQHAYRLQCGQSMSGRDGHQILVVR